MTPSDRLVCPECGSTNIADSSENADGFCQDCGLVTSTQLANSTNESISETYDQEDSTEESSWQEHVVVKDSSDQNLVRLLEEMDSICDLLEIDASTRVTIAELSTEAWENRITHGRCLTSVAAAAILVGSRHERSHCPLDIVAERAGVEARKLNQTKRVLMDELDVELPPPTPEDYIPFITCQCSLPTSVEAEAMDLSGRLDSTTSGSPVGVAAGMVYLAAENLGNHITLKRIGAEVGLTKETVWKHASTSRENID